ncbi:pre-rRNA-processing protein TSR4 [Sarotherodon galilaeus]
MIEHFDSATGNVSVAEHLPVRKLDEDEALCPFKAIKGLSYISIPSQSWLMASKKKKKSMSADFVTFSSRWSCGPPFPRWSECCFLGLFPRAPFLHYLTVSWCLRTGLCRYSPPDRCCHYGAGRCTKKEITYLKYTCLPTRFQISLHSLESLPAATPNLLLKISTTFLFLAPSSAVFFSLRTLPSFFVLFSSSDSINNSPDSWPSLSASDPLCLERLSYIC